MCTGGCLPTPSASSTGRCRRYNRGMRWATVSLLSVAASCTFEGPANQAPAADAAPEVDAGPRAACASMPEYSEVGLVGRYRFIDTRLQYEEAIAACEADEARLAIPVSLTQVEALANELIRLDVATPDCFLGGPSTPCGLVGLRQAVEANDPEALWQRGDGEVFAGNDPMWRPGQPDDDDSNENSFENCAVIYTSDPLGLDDRPCSFFEYPAICECR